MTRYQALRKMKFDPLAAAVVAFFNWLADVPQGIVVIMFVVIEYEEQACDD